MFKPVSAAMYRCPLASDIARKPRYPIGRGPARLFDAPAPRRAPPTGSAVLIR